MRKPYALCIFSTNTTNSIDKPANIGSCRYHCDSFTYQKDALAYQIADQGPYSGSDSTHYHACPHQISLGESSVGRSR